MERPQVLAHFLRCASHRAEIFAQLAAFPKFPVATIRSQSSESTKHVSLKSELCSEYGIPKNCARWALNRVWDVDGRT